MLNKLRGFREIYPNDMHVRKRVFDTIRKVADSFGFQEVDVPSVEPLELFTIKSGQELVMQTFSFKDKSGRMITLIPEITPTISRMIAQRKDLIKPIKWYSIPKLWRYEEPQSGRLREFYQFNADIFGVSSVAADAEVIALAITILNRLGLENKYRIKISDRILLENILNAMNAKDIEAVFRIIDKSEKIDELEFKTLLAEHLSSSNIALLLKLLKFKGHIDALKTFITYDNAKIHERLAVLEKLDKYLSAYNVKEFEFDLTVVRGLAYYSGIVFEARDVNDEFRAILGGGRYDHVVELFGTQSVPAVGFGMGDVVLELMLRREGLWNAELEQYLDYYIITTKNVRTYALNILSKLRARGFKVDIDMGGRSLSNQLKYANKINVKKVLIIGDKELYDQSISIKDMKTGEQITILLDDFFDNY